MGDILEQPARECCRGRQAAGQFQACETSQLFPACGDARARDDCPGLVRSPSRFFCESKSRSHIHIPRRVGRSHGCYRKIYPVYRLTPALTRER